jgi:hypothetical protein
MATDPLAELIADAQRIVLPAPRVVELPCEPRRPLDEVIRIPESAASLVASYADYGS